MRSNWHQEMKTPTEGGFRNRLTDGVAAAMLPASKQMRPAMTNQLYTISLKSRNKTALVSFQSHFQERCKQDYVTGRKLFSCNTGSRRTEIKTGCWLDGSLNPSGRAALDKCFLIWIGTRLESYGSKAGYVSIGSLPLL